MKKLEPIAMLILCCSVTAGLAAPANKRLMKYDDGEPDGRKSLGGSGHMIKFTLPQAHAKVKGIRVYGSRYGYRKAPDEDFLVYILGSDMAEIVHTHTAPYKLFEHSEADWVKVKFKKPVEVPQSFWIVLDFRAHRTKGVYVSFDTSTGGQYSKIGLPGQPAQDVDFGGDWMIRVDLAR